VLRAESVAQRVHESLAEAFSVGGTECTSALASASACSRVTRRMPRAPRNAETAMFEAKRTGGTNYVLSGGATRTPALGCIS
jgi:hypothetical protein